MLYDKEDNDLLEVACQRKMRRESAPALDQASGTPGHPDAIVEHKFGSQFSIIRLGAEYKKRSIYDRDFHADTRED